MNPTKTPSQPAFYISFDQSFYYVGLVYDIDTHQRAYGLWISGEGKLKALRTSRIDNGWMPLSDIVPVTALMQLALGLDKLTLLLAGMAYDNSDIGEWASGRKDHVGGKNS